MHYRHGSTFNESKVGCLDQLIGNMFFCDSPNYNMFEYFGSMDNCVFHFAFRVPQKSATTFDYIVSLTFST